MKACYLFIFSLLLTLNISTKQLFANEFILELQKQYNLIQKEIFLNKQYVIQDENKFQKFLLGITKSFRSKVTERPFQEIEKYDMALLKARTTNFAMDKAGSEISIGLAFKFNNLYVGYSVVRFTSPYWQDGQKYSLMYLRPVGGFLAIEEEIDKDLFIEAFAFGELVFVGGSTWFEKGGTFVLPATRYPKQFYPSARYVLSLKKYLENGLTMTFSMNYRYIYELDLPGQNLNEFVVFLGMSYRL